MDALSIALNLGATSLAPVLYSLTGRKCYPRWKLDISRTFLYTESSLLFPDSDSFASSYSAYVPSGSL